VAIHAANYQANRTLADIYYGKGEYATAALYYRHLATLNPTDLVMVTNLGWCYLQLRQLDQAEQIFNNVLTVSPLDNSARQGINRLPVMRRGRAINQAVMKRLMAALDADGDGELSEQEMAGAAAMLRKLDLDRDGTITAEELQQPLEEGPDAPSR
jgi:tetratricopeptide (TPR) repeat protein